MMNFVVRLAPLGRVWAIAFTVGKYGIGSLRQLGGLVALFYVAVAVFCRRRARAVMRFSGFSLFKLLRYLREELTIVLGTAAGDSVLPQTMRKLELSASSRRPSVWSSRRDIRSIWTPSRSI
jgi:aerobic C4-dicarboxylate transport protein